MKHLLIILLSFTNFYAQKVLVNDNFEKDNYNWTINKEGLICEVVKNGFSIKNENVKDSKWRLLDAKTNLETADFDVEATIKLIELKSEKSYYGLVWAGYNDNSNYHVVNINEDKKNQAYWYHSKKFEYDLEWTENKNINKKENTIKVSKRAQNVFIYINDKLVVKTNNTYYYGDNFGFIVGPETEIEVSNLKITEIPLSIDVVDDFDETLKVEKLPIHISSEESTEKNPVISPDGKTLFFDRQYSKLNIDNSEKSDVWFSTIENDVWTEAQNMGRPINNSSHNFVISVSPDNNTLLLGNKYSQDGMKSAGPGISVSSRSIDGWSIPVSQTIDGFVNKNKYVSYFLANDNKTLLMSIENEKSLGEKDLFVSFLKKDGTWTEPKNMGKVLNTEEDEANPHLASDGKTLYFSSKGHPGFGSYDLFVSKRLDDSFTNWSKPKNLGKVINSTSADLSIFLAAKGDKAYIGRGIDLYEIDNTVKQDPVVLVKGKVYDSKTGAVLSAPIVYNDLKSNAELGTAISDIKTGSYSIILPFGKTYSFMAEKKGYYAVTQNVDLSDLKEYKEVTVDLYLNPIEKGQTIRLNNIFFDSGKYDLLPESNAELNKLYDILVENKQLKIEIAGHTDAVGADKDNLVLSKNRANAVMQYLVAKGIAQNRLTANGFGETKFIATNDTEEGKQLNRRVEFSILEL